MKSKEFGDVCKHLNGEYKKLFNEIPSPADYVGSHKTFFEALQKSIETKKPISEYLRKSTIPKDPRAKY